MSSKQIALAFLTLITEGKIDEAYEKYIDMSGRHHNPTTPAGMTALKKGMQDAEIQFPHKTYYTKLSLEDGPLAAIFGELTLKTIDKEIRMATVHVCRVKNGKIIELWDCAQNLPDRLVNTDGPF